MNEWMNEWRKERRKEGRKEGSKEGRKEGGRKEGRKEGRKSNSRRLIYRVSSSDYLALFPHLWCATLKRRFRSHASTTAAAHSLSLRQVRRVVERRQCLVWLPPHQSEASLYISHHLLELAVDTIDCLRNNEWLLQAQFVINVNCIDPHGRTALLIAIENDNIEMIDLLLSFNVTTHDALLHAINEDNVEATQHLLIHQRNDTTQTSVSSYNCLSPLPPSPYLCPHVWVWARAHEC